MPHIIFREPETCYGKAASGCKIADNIQEITVTSPPNATATVFIPAISAEVVTERGLPITQSKDVKVVGTQAYQVVVKIGSGECLFAVRSDGIL